MICEKCEKDHNGNFGSGRFCSMSCAKSRYYTEEEKLIISNRMKGRHYGNAISMGPRVPKDTRQCLACQQEFVIERWKNVRCCSKKCGAKNNGGYRPNSGKHGKWYFCKDMNREVYLDSTWEVEYASWLDRQNIRWNRPNYYLWIDSVGKRRKYFPDFLLLDTNELIDVKNDYLIKKDVDKIQRVSEQNNIEIKILSRKELDNLQMWCSG